MDLSRLSEVIRFDPHGAPSFDLVLAALPADLRTLIDQSRRALEAAEAAVVDVPVLPLEVVRGVAADMESSLLAGKQFDVVKASSVALASADENAVAFYTRALTIQRLQDLIRAQVMDVLTDACQVWTSQIQALQVEAGSLVASGAVLDELDARRQGGKVVTAWEKLVTVLADADKIIAAHDQARYLLDGQLQDRFRVNGRLQGELLDNDVARIRAAMESAGHLLLAANALGVKVWCPTLSEQVAAETAEVNRRLAAA